MDASNSPNQQQRYCQTPIMAPPAVGAATSPPMGAGSVMNSIHQPTHHPPPSISPHPAYYHHGAGTSHYPTPSPTPPPPMHHQPYYNPNHYYAHGSHHQPQQPQAQQSQHHGIANSHVPINAPQGSVPQGGQHPHMMGHGGYHHPQSQPHQQHWAQPAHPHQQQGHHYYQHHSPPQQPTQQTQPHGYPPPTHSPYPYAQPHPPPPTPPPPPHTPHSQSMHQQPVPQQQHPPPQVSASPSPVPQMHQPPSQQQQTQPNHALMNLSRFVNQSPSPSPRASPSLAVSHHPQQRPPSSPSAYAGHIEHHSSMNGHTNIGANSPVMSPPPPPVMQQPMSPTSPAPQQHMIMSQPPQHPGYAVNGGPIDHNIPTTNPPTDQLTENHAGTIDAGKSNATGVFSNITPSKIASIMNIKQTAHPSGPPPRKPSLSESEMTEIDNSLRSNHTTPNKSYDHRDSFNSPDITQDYVDYSYGQESSTSPTSKPAESPTSSGNGHQMMPVRLQNMHKGARTKATMKKLLQEQHITPNGQGSDGSGDVSMSAKETDGYLTKETALGLEKPVKSPKKKKGLGKGAANTSTGSLSQSQTDLDGSLEGTGIRPGYTKSGKKIGRPRKDPLASPTIKKQKKPKDSKSPVKKAVSKSLTLPIETIVNPEGYDGRFEFQAQDVDVREVTPIKRPVKDKRRVPVIAPDDSASELESFELPDLNYPLPSEFTPVSDPVAPKKGKKRSSKKVETPVVVNTSNSTDSSPDSAVLNNIPGSKISQQEAQSVAQRIVQTPSPSPAKRGKRKGKKALHSQSDEQPKLVQKQSKLRKGTKTAELSPKKEPVAVKRSELPRLRSRSPKIGESPPLRISSPRAAKERSATPASSRSRAGKDKDSESTTTTPLSSPLLRSPKKTQEKAGVRSSSRQKAMESMQTDTPETSLDTAKVTPQRSRQASKVGSADIVEAPKKGRRKVPVTELPLPSSDSEKSPLVSGKRMSRRKSGSVTGSTDNLSSPSFNQTSSSLSMIISDGSLEMPSDLSVSINLNNISPGDEQPENDTTLASPVLTSTPAKRGRGKRATKGRRKQSRLSVESEPIPDATTVVPTIPDPPPEELPENPPVTTLVIPSVAKVKGRRKSGAKKGRKKGSVVSAPATVDSLEEPVTSEIPILKVPLKAKAIRGKRSGAFGRPRKIKVIPDVPVPAILGLTKKNVKFKAAAVPVKQKRKCALKPPSDAEQLANPLDSSLPSTELMSASGDGNPDVSPPKRRRSSTASATNTQVSAKANSESVAPDTKVKVTVASGISPTATPKTLRRDSRSVSRDIVDVSVVLTDISQTFAAGETSVIVNSSGRFNSPSAVIKSTPVTSAATTQSPSKMKEETVEKHEPSQVTPTPKVEPKNMKKPGISRKSEQRLKKSEMAAQQKQDFLDRRAQLEAEVALMLSGFKDKEIPNSDGSLFSPSCTKEVISPEKTKPGKRKHSKSPRRSVDSSAKIEVSASGEEGLLIPAPKVETPAVLPAIKIKRKYTKGRRSSKAKDMSFNINDSVESKDSSFQVLSVETPPVSDISSVPNIGKIGKRTPKKSKVKQQAAQSPDIISLRPTSPPTALPVAESIPKKKGAKKSKLLNGTIQSHCTSLVTATETNSAPLKEEPVPPPGEKLTKKRGKRKLKSEPVPPQIPSTSVSDQQPSTSTLYPLTFPAHKPTIVTKACRFADLSKEEDNQKKKMEVPSLRVLGGATKFYRGGELEEVDQEPKFVKEKTQPQTDNAVPWICSLCHLGPHAQKLGDLFGPYFAHLPSIYGPPSSKRETWMHGDCALWAGRLIMVGTYLRRLEETLRDADKQTCNVCGKNGATIGCLRRGCRQAVHYPCAVRRFWKMDEQNFHSYCPNHIP